MCFFCFFLRKNALRKIKVDKESREFLMKEFDLDEHVAKRVLQTHNNDLSRAVQYLIHTQENILDKQYMRW